MPFQNGVVFQSSSYKCNAIPEWRRVSIVDCCSKLSGGEIGF